MKKTWKQYLSILFVVLLIAGTMPSMTQAKQPVTDYDQYQQVDVGKDGMVATAHPLASQIGADILKKGGNAIDAAVAVQFALNVTEPMMSGIGGGGFMMVFDGETKETSIVNSRERAPTGASPDMFLDGNGNPIPFAERSTNGTAVGVPGTIKGLETALEKWGTKSMQQLISPSIKLAEKGFPIDSVLAKSIAENKDKLNRSAAGQVFLPNGTPLKEGERLVQKDLAKTLKLIRSKGTNAFYKGEVAESLVKTVQDFGGSMTTEDLAGYEVTMDEPIWGEYQEYQIASMPPPSSGGVFLLQMLQILDDFNLSQYPKDAWEKYHLLAETMHLAYADRAVYAGDPEFVNVPVKGLLHPDYIKERQQLISLDKVNVNPVAGNPWEFENDSANYEKVQQPNDRKYGETTHFSITDKWGNVVSYTTTIEQEFGTGIMVPNYGFFLNNELTDFDAIPGGANEVQPNKRPLSSMTPTIVFENNQPVLTVGSPGGPTIIASVLQTIVHAIEYDMDLKAAVEEPRIYTNNMHSYRYEEGIAESVIYRLNEMGHQFGENPTSIGNVQSILIDHENKSFKGVADSSRNGAAIGINLKGKKHKR